MSAEVFVLVYHRVCEPEARTACWFARGTAIPPACFEAQIAWLCARLVSLDEARVTRDRHSSAPRRAL